MFSFYLKKNFCDLWDNFFQIFLFNLVPMAIVGFCAWIVTRFGVVASYLPYLIIGIAVALVITIMFAWGANARKIADFNSPSWTLFLKSLKGTFVTGFLFGLMCSFGSFVIYEAFTVYFRIYMLGGQVYGLVFAIIIAAFAVVAAMALQWFIPLYFLQEQNNFAKCFKKSFIIFFDNMGFTFKTFLNNIFLSIITVMTFGIVPGLNGIVLSSTNALRLRLYKYDWMEDNGYFDNRDAMEGIPWDELLAEDKEILGTRKIASFLFPWK